MDPGLKRRRVAGLRREELAPLAGVSVGYYTRLGQGQSPNVSDEVLDAIAHARCTSTGRRRRATTSRTSRCRWAGSPATRG